ncbi:hypothetical protein L1049_014546 [Liquidambar formosana]|uniref:TF-B3 domain-containing protein n=1 Tax=Liquidambar formosana TaxID=63359 RepID=A0AAP0WZ32_LIQFO
MIDLYSDHVKAESPAMERAEEIRASLAAEFPSFVKLMLQSHVTRGFWLGLPKRFCDLHIPRVDHTVVLEDESGEETETKYLGEKVGLSAGWRGFSIAHKLLEGDVVVFHLVRPSKFKVYIVRSNSLDEVDGALGLLNLEASSKRVDLDTKMGENAEEKCSEIHPLDFPQVHIQQNTQVVVDTKIEPIPDQSEDDSEDLGSEVLEGIRFSESVVDFKEVNSIENFTILVNGLIIDSEFSKHIRTKYYELCRSQNSFLHDHLLEGINCKLAAGIILETINIADAIRASKVSTTSQDAFTIWDKTLKAFEGLGMNVGFLRARLEQLSSLASESEKCTAASIERSVRADEEMKTLRAKLLEIREAGKRLDAEIEAMKVDAERMELIFQEEG